VVAGTVVVDSTVVAQNASFGCLMREAGQITSHGYNIESPGNTCNFGATGDRANIPAIGAGGLNLDPNLAANGPQPYPYTRALLPGSVAINAIPTTSGLCPPNGGSMDERGNVRAGQINAGDHRGGLACDVGAYEFDSTETVSAITTKNLQGETTTARSASGLVAVALTIAVALIITGSIWIALRRHPRLRRNLRRT
jgi:hypothetical protein